MIIVSACLCGINCKYNGENNYNEEIFQLFKQGKLIPMCPEQLGGLKTPRIPCEIIAGRGGEVLDGTAKVLSKDGSDITKNFIRGAYEVLDLAKKCGVKIAILKSKSPSCGCGMIYDGTFTGTKVEGNGVTAELLIRNNIKIYTEGDKLDMLQIKMEG